MSCAEEQKQIAGKNFVPRKRMHEIGGYLAYSRFMKRFIGLRTVMHFIMCVGAAASRAGDFGYAQ